MDHKTQLVSVAGVMLLVANIIAAKIISMSVPIVGTVTASAGVFPIAITFLCTDIIAERYGKKEAKQTVWTIVGILVVGWGTIQLVVVLPHGGGVPQESFAATLQASTPLVIASITTAVAVQLFDVFLFTSLRQWTDGKYRWLRNIGSTGVSQLCDTTMFTVLAFAVVPSFIGGTILDWSVIFSIIFVEYIIKLFLALFDTPIFYALTADQSANNVSTIHDRSQ